MKAVFLGAILAAPAVAGRKLLDMTPGQAQNLKNLQQQAAVAQGQQQQAALQLAAAQSQVAQASEQLANQENQLADVNAAQQSNVAELSVLLPPQGAPGPAPQSAAAAAALKRLEANSQMEGGIASIASSYVYSPPPPLLASPPPPVYLAPAPAPVPSPSPPPPPSPVVGFSAPAKDVAKKGETSFAPGTVTYWETVVAPAPSAGFRRLQQQGSDSAAYEEAVNQEEQTIAAANAAAAQDAAQAAHDQYAAENMQIQQRNIEANAEAKQAALLVQSQVLTALQAPTPAPAPAPAPGASTEMKSRESAAGMEGSMAAYGRRRLAQTLTSALASATQTSTLEVAGLNGYVQQADSDEAQTAHQMQSSEQSEAQVNDATDNHQLTQQEEGLTNKATQKPKLPSLSSFAPSPPIAHKSMKEREAAAGMSGSIAAGAR